MSGPFYSDVSPPSSWSETVAAKSAYGPKGAGLMCLPREWTLPFILVSAADAPKLRKNQDALGVPFRQAIRELGGTSTRVIVRSSVIGETIWDRGNYRSLVVDVSQEGWEQELRSACASVLDSAAGRDCALVIQRFVEPRERGEFGNLLRISKTRDQWELSTRTSEGTTNSRLNTQRDAAASEQQPLVSRPRLSAERLFGSVAAWINNSLVLGQSARLNVEWVRDNTRFYLVQIDEENDDLIGVNPLQINVAPAHESGEQSGLFIRHADHAAIARWDKLRVLEELWGPLHQDRPSLFVIPLDGLPSSDDARGVQDLAIEFGRLLGPDNIVVRTSVLSGAEKTVNLPRTECLTPTQAADWCLSQRDQLSDAGVEPAKQSFVAHRYIDARASAWARADPSDPTVEINSLWGLPDALQYCPYDIWEVHVPTESATEYPEYKSNMLRSQTDGSWSYVRVKNEVARSLSITRKEAIDIALRTHEIAARLGRVCHVMWFVGCVDTSGRSFNIPWYWNEAHAASANHDRARHFAVVVKDRQTLQELARSNADKSQHMLVLRPQHPDLFRDNEFIKEVADEANLHGMPVDLEGSTLAHAYYQLIKHGCTVIASSEKDHSRIRKNVPFGKLVRDKIPDRIAARQELGSTKVVPSGTKQAFLIGKILEEALEVRESSTAAECKLELADLIEIVRALGEIHGLSLNEIIEAADGKREKLGGFERGQILLQTGIGGPGQNSIQPNPMSAQVLSRNVGPEVVELPFTFFGFSELEQARSIRFANLGFSIEITLKNDRLALRLVREPEQLELPMSLEIDANDPGDSTQG